VKSPGGPEQPSSGGPARPKVTDEPPPFLGTWPRLYAAVLGWLGLLVLLMHFFTQRYR
jgi:hypothetical protein